VIALCAFDALAEGQARGVAQGDLSLVLIKREGIVYAYRNICPHLGVELNWQPDVFLDADGQWLQCSMHGALFEPKSGRCVFGPCRGQAITSVPLVVTDGMLYMM